MFLLKTIQFIYPVSAKTKISFAHYYQNSETSCPEKINLSPHHYKPYEKPNMLTRGMPQ